MERSVQALTKRQNRVAMSCLASGALKESQRVKRLGNVHISIVQVVLEVVSPRSAQQFSCSATRQQTQVEFSQDACPNLISLSADYPKVPQGWASMSEFNIAACP